jgi:hypothetical protein
MDFVRGTLAFETIYENFREVGFIDHICEGTCDVKNPNDYGTGINTFDSDLIIKAKVGILKEIRFKGVINVASELLPNTKNCNKDVELLSCNFRLST